MITIRKNPSDRVLELGGGERPLVHPECRGGNDCHVDVRMMYDADNRPLVDFCCDFNQPLPISSDEFDSVVAIFVIEHLSFGKIPQFIGEMLRVIKPGGKALVVCPNTEAQLEWVKNHPEGWDGKDFFTAASEVLYGSQDYEENTHKAFLTPAVMTGLFVKAGFENVLVQPYGERSTDMAITASKPAVAAPTPTQPPQQAPAQAKALPAMSREEMFDRAYWNGGTKVGGYAREGYRDFPVHAVTAAHVLQRKPVSVLELGAARGYVLKRVQDAGVTGYGLEISEHCHLTRVCDGITLMDMCDEKWPFADTADKDKIDLCYSVAVLEHIPEEFVPHVIREMARTCQRGLHGVDFGHNDDGFDKTHVTLRPREWWLEQFEKHAPGWPVEVVDKEELERGPMPFAEATGDGKIKLNLGCHTTQFGWGWVNIDSNDLSAFAQQNGYKFLQHDIRSGLPYKTGEVSLIAMSHVLEHLTYAEGQALLKECRRVLKKDGCVRIAVPDADFLANEYGLGRISNLDEIMDEATAALPDSCKFFALLTSGHQTAYDYKSLAKQLTDAGFAPYEVDFRTSSVAAGEAGKQINRECQDMHPCLSLYMEGVPS